MELFNVIVEVSARHIHLCRRDIDILFGSGYELTRKKDLSQPGQYACEERVAVVGPKGEFKSVSILGPERPDTQIEVSISDTRTLGVNAPVRESGDVKDSCGIKLVGPNGETNVQYGLIVAKRHMHVSKEDAEKYNIQNNDMFSVKLQGERAITLHNVFARVSSQFNTRIHLDTDEANAAGVGLLSEGMVIRE